MTQKLWQASSKQKKNSILFSFEKYISKKFNKNFSGDYQNILNWSIKNSPEFWSEVLRLFFIVLKSNPVEFIVVTIYLNLTRFVLNWTTSAVFIILNVTVAFTVFLYSSLPFTDMSVISALGSY